MASELPSIKAGRHIGTSYTSVNRKSGERRVPGKIKSKDTSLSDLLPAT